MWVLEEQVVKLPWLLSELKGCVSMIRVECICVCVCCQVIAACTDNSRRGFMREGKGGGELCMFSHQLPSCVRVCVWCVCVYVYMRLLSASLFPAQ